MTGIIGDNIKDAIKTLKNEHPHGEILDGYKIEFPICGHPELMPNAWNQSKPEACRTVGRCPVHDYTCPVCGFGVGSSPSCNCLEERY